MPNLKYHMSTTFGLIGRYVLFVTLFHSSPAMAQEPNVLKGFVLELNSGEPLQSVDITNLNTGHATVSDGNGNFSIQVSKNERLRFEYPGYRTDTLVVIEFDVKRVYMSPDGSTIQIDEVQIQAMTDSRLASEIERAKQEGQVTETSQHRGGIRISPSRWFGREGKQARQRYELLLAEQERRKIDERFTPELVSSITPLNGESLTLYMTKYRPNTKFISSASEDDLRLYIMDTYAKFKELGAEELEKIKAPTAKQ